MSNILILPGGLLADASLSLMQTTLSKPIANHCIRSFLFARALAKHEGCLDDAAYDEGLLFAACMLHDLGLGTLGQGKSRFEVEGADLAATLLAEHSVAAPDIDRVWEAIALHSSVGLANRLGLLTSLTHRGIFMGAGLYTDGMASEIQQISAAYPMHDEVGVIIDAIAEHAARSEEAAPPYSISAQIKSQRQATA